MRARIESGPGGVDHAPLAELRERVLDLASREQDALALAQQALDRIGQVDRGAGTVLADVRSLREQLTRLSGEHDVVRGEATRAETEALGARQAAAGAGEVAAAAREDAARARDEASAMRRELDGHEERNALLAEQITGVRADVRSTAESFDERLASVDQRAAALRSELGVGRERLDAVGIQVERLGAGSIELRTEIVQI